MAGSKLSIAIIGIAAVPLMAIAASSLVSGDPPLRQEDRYTLGDTRNQKLLELTGLYVSRHPGASGNVKAGSALAPISFLNDQLKAADLKWRVRSINGLLAETYDVS